MSAQMVSVFIKKRENGLVISKLEEIFRASIYLLRNKYFYLSLLVFICGIELNFFSQTYLHKYMQEGEALPVLSDLILDNLPYWDFYYLYDILTIFSIIVFFAYVIHRRQYDRVPHFLFLCGIFYLVRGVFIVLTPFGNPPMFDGTDGLFNGFSKFELGVYPSGHTGISFMFFLLAKDNYYKILLFGSMLIIILTLFLSRAHYSIDVLSGLFFAYAIKSFGDKHLGY